MKIIIQTGLLFFICWISQIIEGILPFDFPASVIGMILVFALLLTKWIKIEQIREFSDFILGNMAFFFLPVGVSIINYFDILRNWVVQLAVICAVSTVLTFAATAYSMKLVLALMARRRQKKDAGAQEGGRV